MSLSKPKDEKSPIEQYLCVHPKPLVFTNLFALATLILGDCAH